MKVVRVYTKGKVSIMDILDPFIDLKIEELITSSNRKHNAAKSQNEFKELI